MLNPTLSRQRQRGLSLVELMVGIVIGLLIIAAAGTAYITTSRTGRDTLNSSKLNIELRGAMDVMTEEIRRAGSSTTGGANNPFTSQTAGARTDLQVSSNCVEFTYDTDADGVVDTAEYSGFRVNDDSEIEIRNGGAGVVANCANGSWQALTEDNIITIQPHSNGADYFTITYQCLNSANNVSENVACSAVSPDIFDPGTPGDMVDLIETRTVNISMGAVLSSDADMKMELNQQVLVRNHRVVPRATP